MKENKKLYIILSIFAVISIFIGGTFSLWTWKTSTAQETYVVFTANPSFQCAADGGGDIISNSISLIPTDCTDTEHAIQRTVTVTPTLTQNMTISLDLWLDINSIGTGLSNSNNFKYALTTSSTSCSAGVVASGNFNGKTAGDTVSLLYSNEYSQTTTETYYLYIWLDKAETDVATASQNFSLSLNGNCMDEVRTAYAVYSETDSSLRFYKGTEPLSVGDTYTAKVNGVDTELTATAVYTGFETSTSTSNPAWYSNRENITTVVVEDVIKTKSTYRWFYNFKNATYIDVSKLNTSNVTYMSGMFGNVGYNAATFEIIGLENFDTSSVTNMENMFSNAGYKATIFELIGLENWDTSNVIKMQSMFHSAGRNATTWSIGDISGWDTSSVMYMNGMFGSAGFNAKMFDIGDLSGWNVSGVTNMSSMFNQAGYKATTWSIGDISKWNTSGVTDMGYMFQSAGYSATTINIGNIGIWDVSSVTNMIQMFYTAWANADYSLDLSTKVVTKSDGTTYTAWDVTNVGSNYSNFATGVTSKIIQPTWVS